MSDLKSYVERIERLREEKRGLTEDERDIFTEVKSSGYDGKALRKVLQRRAMGDAAVAELDAIVDAYEAALGGKKLAAELISQGASVRQAARKAGVGDGTAQRAKKLISGAPAPPEPPAGGQPLPAGPSPTASALPQAPDVPAGAPDKPDDGDGGIRPATPAEVAAIQAAIDRRNAALALPDHLRRA